MNQTKDCRLFTLYAIAFTSSLGSLSWGYNISIFNALRVYLQTTVFPEASPQSISLLASSLTVGAALGSLQAGKLVNSFGRHKTLVYSDILGIVGCILCMIQYLPFMLIGRAIGGFLIGINGVGIALYNVEMVPVQLKGIMSSISMTFQASGIFLSLAAGFFVPEIGRYSEFWRLLSGLPIVFHVVRALIFQYVFKYETPLYLVMNDRVEEAKEVLQSIYTANLDKHMDKVLKDKEALTMNGNPTMRDMLSPKYRRAFLVGIFVMSGIQFCGFSPIFMFFNIFIAESADNNPETISLFATMMGVMSVIAAIAANIFVEKYGRRPLLIYGMGLMCITQTLYAVTGYILGQDSSLLKYIIMIWPLFYRISVGTLAYVNAAEVAPSVGVSMIVCSNWVFAFINVQSFLPMLKMIGVNGVMLVYAFYGAVSVKMYQWYVIESKGRTKAEMLKLYNEREFGSKVGGENGMELKQILICKE